MTAEATVSRYSRLRWVGIALFCVALAVGSWRAWLVVSGELTFFRGLLPVVLACGLSLGSFGAANDTAVHGLLQLDRDGRLPPSFSRELTVEREVRPGRLREIHASPRLALALPFVAGLLLVWLVAGPLMGRS